MTESLLSINTLAKAITLSPKPLRLSDQFLKLWCKEHKPTEELDRYLRERGFILLPATDQHGGWDLKIEGPEDQPETTLFG